MDLIITETPAIVAPERDISFTSIPGKSGDVISDNGRYKNIEKEYRVTAIADPFDMPLLAKKITAWLQSEAGYGLLSDTYDPNYFYYARYTGKISIADKMRLLGAATLKFYCKPFKYSFEGQKAFSITTAATVINPEGCEATPYIKITGSGDITLSINNASFAFVGVDEYIEVDSEMMIAFKGTALQNNKTLFTDFPKLSPGTNNISWTGAVASVEIVPRWCAL
jgi:predicted phage tail component-like protein